MIYAKQSTAIIVTVGPVLDADGVAVTGSVVGDFKISKNGGAPAALNGSATLTHRATGHYSLSLTTSDVDTVGTAEIICDDTTNACPMKEIQVLEEAIYDALFAASANAFTGAAGSTTLTALASGSITAAVIATGAIDADAIADGAIDAGALAADAITAAKVAADVTTEIQSGLATAAELAKVPKSDSNVTWNATAAAQIQSEANDALVAYDPPTRAEATADKDEILTDTTDIQARLPAALVAGRMASNAEVVGDKTGYRLSATGVDDIWDEAIAGHLGAGSVGEALGNAGAAGDPWATALPGAYGAGTAGQIIGDFINAPLDVIDGIVDAIKLKTDNLPASPAAVGSAMTLTAGERNSIADAYLDRADAIETGLTPRQALRGIAAIGVGDVTGGPTTPVFKGAGVGTTRVTSTADADGNRTVVLNL